MEYLEFLRFLKTCQVTKIISKEGIYFWLCPLKMFGQGYDISSLVHSGHFISDNNSLIFKCVYVYAVCFKLEKWGHIMMSFSIAVHFLHFSQWTWVIFIVSGKDNKSYHYNYIVVISGVSMPLEISLPLPLWHVSGEALTGRTALCSSDQGWPFLVTAHRKDDPWGSRGLWAWRGPTHSWGPWVAPHY